MVNLDKFKFFDNLCRGNIDTDRAKMAMETGIYSRVELRRLQPMTCSPKNNLIIGVAAVK